ncbi:hypothetical protein NDU88_006757 [Pleurodeles waltl]|uniref:Uncharacterized protein n=1 Tax=Pleurodeles waltl TaxID=8319 RepID=A0AAV7RR62_PLEWA|nr:hypothetical protein NDU88_006757 [Pleurodeles waltl]
MTEHNSRTSTPPGTVLRPATRSNRSTDKSGKNARKQLENNCPRKLQPLRPTPLLLQAPTKQGSSGSVRR